MASLGQELKRERELRGISLKEIANQTKISLRLLEALEKDQLDLLPGKFFIKAIMREYAKSIGLEENSVLNKYYETSYLKEQYEESEEKRRKSHAFIPKNKKILLSFTFVLIFLLLVFSSYFLFFPKKETPVSSSEPQSPSIQQEVKPALPVIEPAEEEKEIILEISFLERTWIQVYADGELRLDGIKLTGQQAQIIAQEELLISLGNAGGISYTLNNKKGKPLGRSGAVRKNVKITLENIQQFLEQEEEIKTEEKEIIS